MAIDYNRLMEELDSCLGLESSATKSVKRPSGPPKKRKAFEGYDDVDMEIIQAMKDSPEGAPSEFSEEDLVYSEDTPEGDQGMPRVEDDEGGDEESPEIKLADSVDCLFNNYIESGKTPQEAADSIKDLVESAVAELYDPDDEEGGEAEADESCKKKANEGMEDVVTPVKEVSSHSLANRSARESSSESKNNGKSPSPEENSRIVDDDPYDPDAAFEALSSKMLNRYSQLTHRNQLKSKKSAEEGVSATEVKIDDNAIRRVSCEFAYSGKNLRKMVAEAIKKGVI